MPLPRSSNEESLLFPPPAASAALEHGSARLFLPRRAPP